MKKILRCIDNKFPKLVPGFLLIICSSFINTHASAQTPQVPANFVAVPQGTSLQLTWEDHADNESGFIITRTWDDVFEYSETFELAADTESYIDTDIKTNIQYNYFLFAHNDFGASEEVSTSGMITVEQPPAPANLSAVTGPMTSIEISFTDNSDLESWYEIRHSHDPNAPDFYGLETVVGGELKSAVTHYISDGPFNPFDPSRDTQYYSPNTTVYIKVRAVMNDNGNVTYGPFSPVVSATTNPLPAIPTNFAATVDENNVHLSWEDNSTSEAGFLIARFQGEFSPNGAPVIFVPAGTTEYTDTAVELEPNVRYHYWIVAMDLLERETLRPDLVWPGLFTQTARVAKTSAILLELPATPTDLTAEGISPNSVWVSFTDNSDVESRYEILVTTTADESSGIASYEMSGSEIGSLVEIEIADLSLGTVYYFRVRGITEIEGSTVYGAFSTPVAASTLPNANVIPEAPLAKPATLISQRSFTANWKPVEGAGHYELDVFNTKDGIYLAGYESKIVNDTFLTVTGTKPGRPYIYVVRAVNEAGESPNSNTIHVTKIKHLTLQSVCSDDPSITLRWQILNPNPFIVSFTWELLNTSQRGTFNATPGETLINTTAMQGKNSLQISWLDSELSEQKTTKSSTGKNCGKQKAATSVRHHNMSENLGADRSFSVIQYPNPVTDKFHVTVSSTDESFVEIQIFSQPGKCLVEHRIVPNVQVELDVSSYRPGMYILKAVQGKRCIVLKIIKH
jgi:hypothetical protein